MFRAQNMCLHFFKEAAISYILVSEEQNTNVKYSVGVVIGGMSRDFTCGGRSELCTFLRQSRNPSSAYLDNTYGDLVGTAIRPSNIFKIL
jgi:hypothetical protein